MMRLEHRRLRVVDVAAGFFWTIAIGMAVIETWKVDPGDVTVLTLWSATCQRFALAVTIVAAASRAGEAVIAYFAQRALEDLEDQVPSMADHRRRNGGGE